MGSLGYIELLIRLLYVYRPSIRLLYGNDPPENVLDIDAQNPAYMVQCLTLRQVQVRRKDFGLQTSSCRPWHVRYISLRNQGLRLWVYGLGYRVYG